MDSENNLTKSNHFFDQPKAVWAISFSCVISFMGVALVDPIMPAIATQLQATHSQVALLITSYMLIMSFAMLVTGKATSKWGPKGTMLTGLSLVLIFSALAGLSESIEELVWIRGAWGLGNALFTATALSTLVQVARGGRDKVVILFEAAIGLGFAIGPLVGGLLGSISWRGPFFGVTALMAIALCSTFFSLPKQPKPKKAITFSDPLKVLSHKGVLIVALSAFFYNFGFFTLLGFAPFVMHLPETQLGYSFFGWGIMFAIFAVLITPRLGKALGMIRSLYCALGLYALVLAAITLGIILHWNIVFLIIIAGACIGMSTTLLTTAAMQLAPGEAAVTSAAYNFIRFFGGALGPWLAGPLAESFGLSAPFFAATIALVLSISVVALGRTHLAKIDQFSHGTEEAASEQSTLIFENPTAQLLIAFDGSDSSLRAVDQAIYLASQLTKKSKLTLLSIEAQIITESAQAEALLLEDAKEKIQSGLTIAYEHIQKANLDCTTVFLQGDPAKVIIEEAHKHRANWIFMGNRGLGFLSEALLGSVSREVIHKAPCPVILVH